MNNLIYKTIVKTTLIIIFIGLSSFTLKKVLGTNEIKTEKNGFAVLELFTSLGCSSCPPADAVLAKFAMQNNSSIIPLAFHIDYWNRLGWNDPFSKAQFTERQRNYASQLNVQGNYTPQIVINGKHELVGSYKKEIESIVSEELALPSNFNTTIKKATLENNQITIEFEADKYPNTVINFALVKKKELTIIKRGENSGLKQTNYNIVYDFNSIPNTPKLCNKTSFKFKSEWLPSDFMIVAYLQNIQSGQIIAGTKSTIN